MIMQFDEGQELNSKIRMKAKNTIEGDEIYAKFLRMEPGEYKGKPANSLVFTSMIDFKSGSGELEIGEGKRFYIAGTAIMALYEENALTAGKYYKIIHNGTGTSQFGTEYVKWQVISLTPKGQSEENAPADSEVKGVEDEETSWM